MCSHLQTEGDEELGSFVVDNSFVEYETEYAGDTMLAEDPIIQQVRAAKEGLLASVYHTWESLVDCLLTAYSQDMMTHS